jgi:dihydroorotase
MKPIWIKNARIIDPASKTDKQGDLFINNGLIVDSLSEAEKRQATVIDATGQVACPGLIDIHVHFRDPGQTHKESIETGSWAAASGGFTTVICMPNTNPVCDNAGTIQYILDTVARDSVVRIFPTGTITMGMKGEQLAPAGSLKRTGVIALTDDGKCVQNNELMRRALEYAHMLDLPVMDHCQDYALTEGAVMNEGDMSLKLGLKGWPAAAEDLIVARNVILATYTGAHVHMQHISSAQSVDILRRAKQRGVNVTAEATPHHIALTDECLSTYNTNFKMNPPLRTEADRQALIEGLLDGTLDCLATDHAPHTNYEKDCEIDYAPFGIIGLETCLAVTLETLVHSGRCSLMDALSLLTNKPAKLMKLAGGAIEVGKAADITLFDPNERWTLDSNTIFSRSSNSPWLGKTLTGRVKATLVQGQVVFQDGKITGKPILS